MKYAPPAEVLRRVQEVVVAETGIRVDDAAAARIRDRIAPDAFANNLDFPKSSTQKVTVLMTDLRGFSLISEAYPAKTVLEVLNRFLSRMCEIAVANGGTIDKFMGDAVMVLFGAPDSHSDDAIRALICAVKMQIAMDEMNRENLALGLPAIYMGAGINTGQVMAGLLGSALHSEYTVIGNEVNLASRIEAFSLRGQVLISEATYEQCGHGVEVSEPMDVLVKGRSSLVRLREVLAIPALGLEVPRQDIRKSPRVEAKIPFTYQEIIDKMVLPTKFTGLVLDLGYEGLLGQIDGGVRQHADLLIGLDLASLGCTVCNIYARVRSIRLDRGCNFAGIEFTSISSANSQDIRRLVQLLIQGSSIK